jgi:hypothetical protein
MVQIMLIIDREYKIMQRQGDRTARSVGTLEKIARIQKFGMSRHKNSLDEHD